jgi:hypothetical protein
MNGRWSSCTKHYIIETSRAKTIQRIINYFNDHLIYVNVNTQQTEDHQYCLYEQLTRSLPTLKDWI